MTEIIGDCQVEIIDVSKHYCEENDIESHTVTKLMITDSTGLPHYAKVTRYENLRKLLSCDYHYCGYLTISKDVYKRMRFAFLDQYDGEHEETDRCWFHAWESYRDHTAFGFPGGVTFREGYEFGFDTAHNWCGPDERNFEFVLEQLVAAIKHIERKFQ